MPPSGGFLDVGGLTGTLVGDLAMRGRDDEANKIAGNFVRFNGSNRCCMGASGWRQ